MYWMLSELKYKNADYIYGQYLTEEQQVGTVIMELERFLTKEYLNG